MESLTEREREIILGALRVMLVAVPNVPVLLRLASLEELVTLIEKVEKAGVGPH